MYVHALAIQPLRDEYLVMLMEFMVLSLSTIVLNSKDRQGMYGMQHFCMSINPPYNRL